MKRILGATALTVMAVWFWSLRDEPGAAGDTAFYMSPIAAGAAIGQLFGRPLFGAIALVTSLLLAANLVKHEDSESLRCYAVVIGAALGWLGTLTLIRRWNARRDCLRDE